MPVTVREPSNKDFFAWLDLYAGYGDFYKTTLSDEKALLVWSWLMDDANPLRALVATVDGGALVGLVHYRQYPRPLDGSTGMYIDDLFVAPTLRGNGIGNDLIGEVRSRAAAVGCSTVRWITAPDNKWARTVYDEVARTTDWVTYEITL